MACMAWSGYQDSNLGPPGPKPGDLPTDLHPVVACLSIPRTCKLCQPTIWRISVLIIKEYRGILTVYVVEAYSIFDPYPALGRGQCVIRAGFEPATYCLEGSCSIQLSYRTKWRRGRDSNPR